MKIWLQNEADKRSAVVFLNKTLQNKNPENTKNWNQL